MLQQNFSPEEAPLRVIAAGLSDIGRVRERNEDAIAICEPLDQILSAHFGWLYLLADGAGGHGHAAIAAVVKGNQLLIAHVGDSRAYLFRPSSASEPTFTCLTKDHSLVTVLVGAGIISPEERQSSPARHMILRALGKHEQEKSYPDLMTCLVQPGDRLVLCCDGLWSKLPEQQMAKVVSSNTPSEACAELIRLANEAGGEDNISAVVLSFM